jgi:hypothetical protein
MRVMRRIILPLALATSMAGCASSHKGRAIQLVMASDAIADEVAAGWSAGVDAQIEHCKSTLSEEDLASSEKKAECMGVFGEGEGLEAATQSLVTVQTTIKEAVKCEELKTCAKEVDWAELKTSVMDSWTALKPYYEALKGSN